MRRNDSDARFVRICKALGHPLRARIVDFIAQQDVCIVVELAGRFRVAQSTMSEHLRILKDAGLVTGVIEGPRTCYCLDPDALSWFASEVSRRVGAYASAPKQAPSRQPRLARLG